MSAPGRPENRYGSAQHANSQAGHDPGLLEAIGRVGSSMLGLLHNRLELASIEVAEARERLLFAVIASLAATLLFGGAVVALSAWLAVELWPALGAAVLALIAVAYAAAGAALSLWLRRRLHAEPPLLGDTLAEFQADAAALRGDHP